MPMEEDGAEEEACTALSAEAQQLSALMAAAQPLPPPLALDAEPPAGAPQHPQALWLRCGEAFCGVMSYVGEGGRLSLAHVALFAASEPPVPWGRSRHAVHALLSERAQARA